MIYLKNKKAWIRIFEAFLAIVIVLGVLLTLLNKPTTVIDRSDEILKLQRNILSSVNQDPVLRNQILANNISGVNTYINRTRPSWLNYSVRICQPLDVCPLDLPATFIINHEVYTNSILILSNATTYSERQLKVFFWQI